MVQITDKVELPSREMTRWKEFPGLQDIVNRVAQISWADLQNVPGGPVQHDLPSFDGDSLPAEDENTKTGQQDVSIEPAPSSKSKPSMATNNTQDQSQPHTNPSTQTFTRKWYPPPGYAVEVYRQRGYPPQQGPHAYQGPGYYYQGPPLPLLHQPYPPGQVPHPYWPGSVTQQQYQYSTPYTVEPLANGLYNVETVAPTTYFSPAPPQPSRSQQSYAMMASMFPHIRADAGEKRKRSGSPTAFPLQKRKR